MALLTPSNHQSNSRTPTPRTPGDEFMLSPRSNFDDPPPRRPVAFGVIAASCLLAGVSATAVSHDVIPFPTPNTDIRAGPAGQAAGLEAETPWSDSSWWMTTWTSAWPTNGTGGVERTHESIVVNGAMSTHEVVDAPDDANDASDSTQRVIEFFRTVAEHPIPNAAAPSREEIAALVASFSTRDQYEPASFEPLAADSIACWFCPLSSPEFMLEGMPLLPLMPFLTDEVPDDEIAWGDEPVVMISTQAVPVPVTAAFGSLPFRGAPLLGQDQFQSIMRTSAIAMLVMILSVPGLCSYLAARPQTYPARKRRPARPARAPRKSVLDELIGSIANVPPY